MLIKEVATLAGLTVQEVNRQIRTKRLNATFNLEKKRNEVSEVDFITWQQTRRKPGRPNTGDSQ